MRWYSCGRVWPHLLLYHLEKDNRSVAHVETIGLQWHLRLAPGLEPDLRLPVGIRCTAQATHRYLGFVLHEVGNPGRKFHRENLYANMMRGTKSRSHPFLPAGSACAILLRQVPTTSAPALADQRRAVT